ncbi:MAG: hypothetical protein ACTTJ7_08165 [Treponema sp.]
MGDEWILYVCGGSIVILVIIIIAGSYYHVHKAKFKPKFIETSDGKVRMEFYEFGGLQKRRTERFMQQYKNGQKISWNARNFEIEEIKLQDYNSAMRVHDVKMVVYLKEI